MLTSYKKKKNSKSSSCYLYNNCNICYGKVRDRCQCYVMSDDPMLYWESHRQLLMFVWQVMNQCCTEKVTDSCWCLRDRWWTSVVLRKSQTAVDVCVTGDEPVLYWESQIAVSVCMKCDDPVLSWGSQRQLAISVGVTGGNLVSSWKSQRQLSVFAWQVMTQYCIEKVTHSCQCLRDGWWPGVILKKSETASCQGLLTGDNPVLSRDSWRQTGIKQGWRALTCDAGRVIRCVGTGTDMAHRPSQAQVCTSAIVHAAVVTACGEENASNISRFQLLYTPKFPAFFTSKVPQSNSCF